MAALQVQQFDFDCPPRSGSLSPALRMTANCYRVSSNSPVDGLTLLFFHSTGAHKEQWEPVIEFILQSSPSRFKIREAWAFDSPSHGEAGVLNQEQLQKQGQIVSVYDWAPGVVQFLRSRHVHGHRIVLCGHSSGAALAVHVAAELYRSLVSTRIVGLILIESAMVGHDLFEDHFRATLARMVILISSKRDSWKSREDALLHFQNTRPWSKWDPKVLRLYVESGLYERGDGTVTLKCDKKQETGAMTDGDAHFEGMALLGKVCHAVPVHVVWGARQDFIPTVLQVALCNASEGRSMASVTKVEGAGHMVAQEHPIRLARAICDILETTSSPGSKL